MANTKPKTKPEEPQNEEVEENVGTEPEKETKSKEGGKSWEQKLEALEAKVDKLLSGGTQPETQKVKVPKIPEPEQEEQEQEQEQEAGNPQPAKRRSFLDWLL